MTYPSAGSNRIADTSALAALGGALLLVMPGPLDVEAFAVGRELIFVLGVSIAVFAYLKTDVEIRVHWADVALLTYLTLAWLGLLVASVRPFAWRSVALATATVGLWFVVRAGARRLRRALVLTIVVGATVIATASWLEAIGWIGPLSDVGRAPGGLFGNRNHMAHVLALSLPWAIHVLAHTRSRQATISALAAVALILSVLILARSRTAWIGTFVVLSVLALGTLMRRSRVSPLTRGSQLLRVSVAMGLSVCIVAVVPTVLSWRSERPYRESLTSLSSISSGSGRVRLVQQSTTLRMIADHPLLGVGPGNWQVQYGNYAASGDSSYVPERVVPTNRLPHGDWLGIAAETGMPALVALLTFFGLITWRLWRLWPEQDNAAAEQPTGAATLAALAMLATLGVMGISDPVFLTPAPAALAIAMAAAWVPAGGALARLKVHAPTRVFWMSGAVVVLARPTIVTARQAYGDYLRRAAVSMEDLVDAARWNPADFTSRVRISRSLVRKGRCDLALEYAIQAYRLYPTSRAPLYVIDHCRKTGVQ